MKAKRPMRADRVPHTMNAGKAAALLGFLRDFRAMACGAGRVQWRLFFETGATNKYAPAKHLNGACGAAAVQMATAQVQEQIDGWISNRANEFRDLVQGSSLPPDEKHMLHAINRAQAWFSREDFVMRAAGPLKGVVVPGHLRRLARSIMRHGMKRHRRPNLARLSPRLDSRIVTVADATKAQNAPLWASFKLVGRAQRIHVPLHPGEHCRSRGGQRSNTVLLCTDQHGLSVRLVQDVSEPFAASRAAYTPRTERLGLDFGLSTLLASSEGDRMGRGIIADLIRLDRQIAGIARHRMRSGGKAGDSARYRALVRRVRGMLRTRVNTALNRLVAIHAPAELVIERLDFRSPDLSRRMNRLVQNCGRAVFRAKLADLRERFGIEAAEVASPFTSQECSSCAYVDRRNRRSQSEFHCRFCGSRKHADVNAGRVITRRRSEGLGAATLGKAAILAELVRRFCERWRRPLGGAADPRLTNPYFAEWARVARNALATQGLAPCAQKQ